MENPEKLHYLERRTQSFLTAHDIMSVSVVAVSIYNAICIKVTRKCFHRYHFHKNKNNLATTKSEVYKTTKNI